MKIINENISRILIIRLSSLGDIVLTSALIRMLNEKFPDAEIDFLISKAFSETLKYNPRISNIIEYDKSKSYWQIGKDKKDLVRKLSTKSNYIYDIIIDLQNNIRSRHFRAGLSKNILSVNKNRMNKLFIVYLKRPYKDFTKPIPELYLKTVAPLGISDDGKPLELWLPEERNMDYYPPVRRKFIEENRKIAIAPGAHHFTKRWKADNFLALIEILANEYGAEIHLLGGVADKETTDFIKKNTKVDIYDHSCSTSIIETAEIIDKCSLLICNDTGVMHIAAARQTPVVAIFGSTVREFGFFPYRVPSVVIEKSIDCRPCTHTGRSSCPKKHLNCLTTISVEDVINKIFLK